MELLWPGVRYQALCNHPHLITEALARLDSVPPPCDTEKSLFVYVFIS